MIDIKKTLTGKCRVRQGDRVTVGVSGGADSVCLLILLAEARDAMKLSLSAVHVHHGLRGSEADADAEYVRGLCGELGVPFSLVRIDAAQLAADGGLSVEEAARNARYGALREHAQGGLIAVAHHADDQAETILMNILRGTGVAGAAGMEYRNGDVIRPLLDLRRSEIESFLRSKGTEWRTDSTNADEDITRNRLRHSVMPLLTGINSRAAEHIVAFGRDCREAAESIDCEARSILDVCEKTDGEIVLETEDLTSRGPAVAARLALMSMAELAGGARDLGRVHAEQVVALAKGANGRSVSLPGGLTAVKENDTVVIRSTDPDISEESAKWAERLTSLNAALILSPKIFPARAGMRIPKKEYTKWFDYDKIKGSPSWRERETGDVIELAGVGTKSVARFMVDEKIPASKRDAVPLLADGHDIIWIAGYRISEKYKVTPETKTIIEIDIRGIMKDE